MSISCQNLILHVLTNNSCCLWWISPQAEMDYSSNIITRSNYKGRCSMYSMYTYHSQGSSTRRAIAGSPAPSGQLGKGWVPRAGLNWGSQPPVGPCGSQLGLLRASHRPLTTISKLQTPSPWRWQVANEIAELVKKWLTRALAEE